MKEIDEDIFIIEKFLSAPECESLIERGESLGFAPASVRTGSGSVRMKNIRDNERVTFEDTNLAGEYFQRLSPLIPARHSGAEALGHLFKYYRYAPGQRFKRHRDGVETLGEAKSRLTFLLYLNDDFDGGETVFEDFEFVDGQRVCSRREVIEPSLGMALLFRHERWHEGSAPTSGVKYVLRSDVYYGDPLGHG